MIYQLMYAEGLNSVAIRIALTGVFLLALLYAGRAYQLEKGIPQPLPWKTVPGAFAHTVFIVGMIAFIWTI